MTGTPNHTEPVWEPGAYWAELLAALLAADAAAKAGTPTCESIEDGP